MKLRAAEQAGSRLGQTHNGPMRNNFFTSAAAMAAIKFKTEV
jgi:hypothetical protein